MNYIKIRLLGLGLLILSITVVILSFEILFLGLQIKLGNFRLSDYFIKVINFLIILGVFGYLGYVGYVMLSTGERR
ncbi:hypothetical protein EWF20_01835 [Sulfolobus sp. S-194]|uniref:hypothetical protein n=1 Tax=Sulfolobus sp. S-194 TaxID=2512240 RepID=UPI001436F05C|nr:hypothetical protein [Sulfolobus sp. S-194]QIW23019.1 hypothetical protein EWF20_01835 [Sulfolobus sp. S-194]